jgi:hypothetical protein
MGEMMQLASGAIARHRQLTVQLMRIASQLLAGCVRLAVHVAREAVGVGPDGLRRVRARRGRGAAQCQKGAAERCSELYP